jgi:hypothetical protein
MSLTDGIVKLRQKGASDRLNRELLASVNVAVRTDTIARSPGRSIATTRRGEHRDDPAIGVRRELRPAPKATKRQS